MPMAIAGQSGMMLSAVFNTDPCERPNTFLWRFCHNSLKQQPGTARGGRGPGKDLVHRPGKRAGALDAIAPWRSSPASSLRQPTRSSGWEKTAPRPPRSILIQPGEAFVAVNRGSAKACPSTATGVRLNAIGQRHPPHKNFVGTLVRWIGVHRDPVAPLTANPAASRLMPCRMAAGLWPARTPPQLKRSTRPARWSASATHPRGPPCLMAAGGMGQIRQVNAFGSHRPLCRPKAWLRSKRASQVDAAESAGSPARPRRKWRMPGEFAGDETATHHHHWCWERFSSRTCQSLTPTQLGPPGWPGDGGRPPTANQKSARPRSWRNDSIRCVTAMSGVRRSDPQPRTIHTGLGQQPMWKLI